MSEKEKMKSEEMAKVKINWPPMSMKAEGEDPHCARQGRRRAGLSPGRCG